MTPQEYLDYIVRPNVNDFNENYSDLRYAYNAVYAVDALAAHLYYWAKTNAPSFIASSRDDTHYREQLAQCNQNFSWLRDVAKAQKHVQLTRGAPNISGADQIKSQSIGWGEGPWGDGRHGGPIQVILRLDNGNILYLENIVNESLIFLKKTLEGFSP